MAPGSSSTTDHEYSGWKEAALVLCLGTTVLQMVAFLSPFWAVPATRDYDPNLEGIGLWKYCRWETQGNTDNHVCRDLGSNQPGWLMSTQALMSVGVAIMMLALINIIASECCKNFRYDPRGIMTFIIECFLTAIFCGAGVLVFGMKIQNHPVEEQNGTIVYMKIAWCFGMAVTAVALQLVCALLGVCELLFTRRPMNQVTFQVLHFSVSFPGNRTSIPPSPKPTSPTNGGFDNINFEEVVVTAVPDAESST